MKIKSQAAILVTLGIFIVGIVLTSVTGLWTTVSEKNPSRLTDIENAGDYDPNDIRGSFTFSEISTLYQIPLEDLAAAFGVPEADAAEFKCKDLETIYVDTEFEIGTASARMFTAYYLGLPYVPTEETYLTEIAAQILTEQGQMTAEQQTYLDAHILPSA